MKTVILLMLGLMVGTASLSKSNPEAAEVKTRLTLRKGAIELAIQQSHANAVVKFYDERGFVLYQFKYNLSKGITQRFDVSALSEGDYKIKIKVGDQLITKEFSVVAAREYQTIQIKGN